MSKICNFQTKAVIWKEAIEIKRSSLIYIIGTIIFVLVMQIMAANQLLTNNDLPKASKEILLGYSIIYISIMCIPFLGSTLLSRLMYEERLDSAVHVLLATGMDQITLWIGKMFITYFVTYIVFITTTVIYYFYIYIMYEYSVIINFEIFLTAFIIMPFLAFGFLSLLGYTYWVIKNPQIFGMIFPIAFTIGGWNVAIKYIERTPTALAIAIVIVVAVVINTITYILVKKTSKSQITNI
ncbi:hypothetical protein [Herbinix luporum]|jgi:hypothetical protein|uniref:Putative membrane protein n=1 Tax=Herbinix luporum TaxID=1679721 RepID=A0A0K8J3Z8_9FIRM|nr:hypothetical protein [Herbinix luporum]CUH92205.1 putative membrane protein [Herbinix luporum]